MTGIRPGALEVNDTMTVTAKGFMEVAAVLGRFHELAERLRGEQEVGRV